MTTFVPPDTIKDKIRHFKEPEHKASSIQTLGIVSLVFCGIVGLILSIITLSKANRAMSEYIRDNRIYDEVDLKKIRTGRTCAIISLSIFGVLIVVVIGMIGASTL